VTTGAAPAASTPRTPRTPLPATARPSRGFRAIAAVVIALRAALGLRILSRGTGYVPRRGGAVLVWNHTSHLDLIVTMYDVYRRLGRACRFLAVRELWDLPGFRVIAWLAGPIPVDRGARASGHDPLGVAIDAVRSGELLMVAPEGRISSDLEVGPLHTGAVRIARAAQVPLVPSVSFGSHRISTTGRPFSWGGSRGVPIVVRFGAPLHVGPDDDVTEATARLRAQLRRLLDAAEHTYPDGMPPGAAWVPDRLGGGAPAPPDQP